MLYFIITWTGLTVVSLLIGISLINTFRADCFNRWGDRFIVSIWLGLVALSVSLLTISLFFPLTPLVGLSIGTILVFLSFLSKRNRTEIIAFFSVISIKFIVFFFILENLVAALISHQVTWVDTGLYHAGNIRWLAEYGAVPGVALIHSRFGWASSWLALAAPFNFGAIELRATAITNGFALLITIICLLITINHIFIQRQNKLVDWFFLLSSVIFFLNNVNIRKSNLMSPSPDAPIVLLTIVIAWAMLMIAQSNETNQIFSVADARIIPLILSIGAFTMKLTALPLLLISYTFYIFGKNFRLKRFFLASIILIILLTPMIAFSLITSGCPFSPVTFMCIPLPWTIPQEQAQEMIRSVGIGGWWQQWYGSKPENLLEWLLLLWFWLKRTKTIDQLIVILAIFSIILFIININNLLKNKGSIWIILLGVTGIIFIMTQSPLLRFGLGYFIVIPAFLMANYGYHNSNKIKFRKLYLLISQPKIFSISIVFLATLAFIGTIQSFIDGHFFLPPQLPMVKVKTEQLNDIQYYYPNEENHSVLCWATKPPCALGPIKNIKLRDPSRGIKAGFIRSRF